MLVELENMHQAELDHINQGILSLKSQHTEEVEINSLINSKHKNSD